MSSPVTCMSLVRSHLVNVKPPTENHPLDTWYENHCKAWNNPRGAEVGLKLMIQGYAQMADSYAQQFPDSKMGQDGYFGEHAADLIQALIAALTGTPTGRFHCGSLDRLIRRLAQVSGVELPQ